MEEVFLWDVSNDNNALNVSQLEKVHQAETEELLEEILVKSPEMLFSNLKLVSRQSETAGGPLDLLGVDEDGNLVVFELKRGNLTRDAVAQVIDYGSYLSELEPAELSAHVSTNSGKLGIEEIKDFTSWYQEQFATPIPDRMAPRLVLVGLGVDDKTRRMVSFLADSDIDISLITFHAFKDGKRILLARQVEVQARQAAESSISSKKNNLEKLNAKLQLMHLTDFFRYTTDFVVEKMPQAYAWPNQNGYTYYLQETTESGTPTIRAYLSISLNESKGSMLQLYLHPRATESDSEVGLGPIMQILGMTKRKDGAYEKWIASLEKWKQNEDKYNELLEAVLDGWKKKREKLAAGDIGEIAESS